MRRAPRKVVGFGILFIFLLGAVVLSFPSILVITIHREQAQPSMSEQFPVTVNPRQKMIVESEHVNEYLESADSPLHVKPRDTGNVFARIAILIADAPWYQSLAAVATGRDRLITITPGMRKEQVGSVFGTTLAWNAKQRKEFLTASSYASLPFAEGSFSPGIYAVAPKSTPGQVQALVNDRFSKNVLSRYSTTTAQLVPLEQALKIASLIEREAGGPTDMRIISGIIWNRLFINMKLQIDATLQYAKANTASAQTWWPKVLPADRFRASPYNTYLHYGLPPTPIANPSVASILAALNPKNTPCMFYFHDAQSQFHCTETYAEHVALLKQYYGRGK